MLQDAPKELWSGQHSEKYFQALRKIPTAALQKYVVALLFLSKWAIQQTPPMDFSLRKIPLIFIKFCH
jgi:hypothetical protein